MVCEQFEGVGGPVKPSTVLYDFHPPSPVDHTTMFHVYSMRNFPETLAELSHVFASQIRRQCRTYG